jgi:V8-like Glu-specific endopeptidase
MIRSVPKSPALAGIRHRDPGGIAASSSPIRARRSAATPARESARFLALPAASLGSVRGRRGIRGVLLAGLGIALFAFTACESDDWPRGIGTAAQQAAIVGGSPESGYQAVGALLTGGGLCTGTLIAPQVVLTAAHCVVGATPSTFVIGTSVYASTRLSVQKAIAHPEYRSSKYETSSKYPYAANIAWHDIAVVILSKPSTITPMAVSSSAATSMVGKTVKFVGFGLRDGSDDSTAGRKYQVSTPINSVWSQGFWNVTSSSDPKMTCGGDSGGPAFLVESDGVERIVGVVSSGDEDCVRTGYNTRADTNLTWINQQIAAYGGTVIVPKCPDALCNGDETPYTCPQDCGEPKPACGDGECNGAETKNNCPQDCGQPDPWCGDWKCNGDETPESCPNDCPATGAVCGDGKCEAGESPGACPGDCPPAGFWATCAVDGDCADGMLCVQAEGGNRCTSYCADPDGGTGCTSGYYCVPLAVPPPSGDGACLPSGTTCGDGLCGRGETSSNCATDCRAGCGDVTGVGCCDGSVLTWCDGSGEVKQVFCGAGGSCGWAAEAGYYDCGQPAAADPSGQYPIGCGRIGQSCGDGVCDPGEDATNCAADCRASLAVCGNGVCEPGEDCLSCNGDCPECDAGEIIRRSANACAATTPAGGARDAGGVAVVLAACLLMLRRRRRDLPTRI